MPMPFTDLQRLRAEAPLVHNITNYVVMNNTANALLALGASPVMAHALEEVEELVAISRALVLNIGTLSAPWVEAMLRAGRAAKARSIPVVLDPVGAGATKLRTAVAQRLLEEVAPAVVRANASEIRALAFDEGGTKGVDSTADAEGSLRAARALVQRYGCVVSMSGPIDIILSRERTMRVRNGHPLMPKVTGMGCTASAITGAFAAVSASADEAAAMAMVVNGVAGELAGERASGPGSFQMYFLDALAELDVAELQRRARLEVT
jgi:hydroxyethylthiazole kinase